jgi:hypothetical protein
VLGGSDRGQTIGLINIITQSQFFAMFMEVCEKMMGKTVTTRDIGVSLDIMLALLGDHERILMNDEVSRESQTVHSLCRLGQGHFKKKRNVHGRIGIRQKER